MYEVFEVPGSPTPSDEVWQDSRGFWRDGLGRFCQSPTFVCDCCGERVPYSRGCDDDMPDTCDDCWALAHEHEEEN